MRLFRLSFFRAALGATAAMLAIGSVAISEAERAPYRGQDMYDGEQTAPITGAHLFAPLAASYETHGSDKTCLTADRVFDRFLLDVENVGGEIVLMTDGAQQDFSDAWRGLVGGRRVEVALVLAHLIPEPGGDPIVDVVEIGARGCAVSQTLLAADDWFELIELARSIEV